MSCDRVVVVRVKQGIGNQLFQYAAGLALADECQARLAIYDLGAGGVDLAALLGIDLPEATPQMIRRLAIGSHVGVLPRGAAYVRRRVRTVTRQLMTVYQGADEGFLPRQTGLAVSTARDVYLNGFFQHPTWFGPSVGAVATQLGERLARHTQGLVDPHGTVISFRRGDYVRIGTDLRLDYYENALQTLSASRGPVWVVGDDTIFNELARSWLGERGVAVSPAPDLGTTPEVRDLALLACAERVIMSNSSFCWWGVAAGDTRRRDGMRRIVGPEPWHSLPGAEVIMQSHWHTVTARR